LVVLTALPHSFMVTIMVSVEGEDKHCSVCGEMGLFTKADRYIHGKLNPRCSGVKMITARRGGELVTVERRY